MPKNHSDITVTGKITDIFAHRFVVATATGRILADVGPAGAEQVQPKVGDTVELTGEQKPSELKVARFTAGGRTIEIQHGPKGDRSEAPVDPESALAALRSAGFVPASAPRRKPKHFEVQATRDGRTVEVHVGLDGEIRKVKPVEAADGRAAPHAA